MQEIRKKLVAFFHFFDWRPMSGTMQDNGFRAAIFVREFPGNVRRRATLCRRTRSSLQRPGPTPLATLYAPTFWSSTGMPSRESERPRELCVHRPVVTAALNARAPDAALDLLPRRLVFVYLKRLFGLFGDIGKDARRISVNLAGGERLKFVNYSLTGAKRSVIFANRETRSRCDPRRSAERF